MSKKRLGDLLVEAGMITMDQLMETLKEQKTTGKKIGELLLEKNYVTEQMILEVLEFQLGIPHIDMSKYTIDKKAVSMITENLAKRHNLIPVSVENNKITIAMSDPLNVFAIDDVRIATRMEVSPVIATSTEISDAIGKFYGASRTENIAKEVKDEIEKKKAKFSDDSQADSEVENSPAVKLVNSIIEQAIRRGASDIHIEPFETYIRVRLRVDGQLTEILKTDISVLNALVTRVKILGKMNIAERRIPQDGRIGVSFENNKIDLRVNILPTIFGEKVCTRLIYRTGMQLTKEQLGFCPQDLEKFTGLLMNPHGVILVTGPTGSGKSTTLATAIREINKPNVNIVTVEDPVENMIDGVNQVHVNVKAGLTFASSLRAILRQDPDIVMIGEMRDNETCNIAVKAAITGHLVLSTLHTNDAASTVTRLIDMGVEPYLVATAVKGVVSQRLVRRICTKCKTEYKANAIEAKTLKIKEGTTLYKGKGCQNCNRTGYKGRVAVHEILVMDEELGVTISKGGTSEEIKKVAEKNGMISMYKNTRENVLKGLTTVEELLRVAYGQD